MSEFEGKISDLENFSNPCMEEQKTTYLKKWVNIS